MLCIYWIRLNKIKSVNGEVKELLTALQEQIEKRNGNLFDIYIDINQEDEEDLVAKRKTLEDSIGEHRAHEKSLLKLNEIMIDSTSVRVVYQFCWSASSRDAWFNWITFILLSL